MRKSVEFRMPESQEGKFVEFLNYNTDTVLISASSDTCRPRVIKEFYKKDENIFWSKAYIAAACEVDKIKMAYVKSCSHYVIEDTFEAPVIEIRRGINKKGANARLYAELCLYKDGEKIYKGQEFENLYKKIETWIKINYSIVEPGYMNCLL